MASSCEFQGFQYLHYLKIPLAFWIGQQNIVLLDNVNKESVGGSVSKMVTKTKKVRAILSAFSQK
jgi:hypothetical protein